MSDDYKPVRSRSRTLEVIAVVGDWACSASVRINAQGEAVVQELWGFERDGDDEQRDSCPDDIHEQLEAAAEQAYYEATEPAEVDHDAELDRRRDDRLVGFA